MMAVLGCILVLVCVVVGNVLLFALDGADVRRIVREELNKSKGEVNNARN